MFWRVVMWPLLSGANCSTASAKASICSGLTPPIGKLHADHLHVGLALAVDALLQAEADELLLGLLAAQEAGRLGVEVVELALEDRDHVAGDVLVDLGVLERAELALAVLLLARVLLEGRGVRELLGGRRLAVGGVAPFFSGAETGSMETGVPFVDVALPGLLPPAQSSKPDRV